MIDHEALRIALDDWLLDASRLQSLHENRQPISVPPDDLDSISASIDKHEVVSEANVASEFGLDNGMKAVVRSSHVDSLHVEVDSSGRSDGKHRSSNQSRTISCWKPESCWRVAHTNTESIAWSESDWHSILTPRASIVNRTRPLLDSVKCAEGIGRTDLDESDFVLFRQ